jgi:hypothetical protein
MSSLAMQMRIRRWPSRVPVDSSRTMAVPAGGADRGGDEGGGGLAILLAEILELSGKAPPHKASARLLIKPWLAALPATMLSAFIRSPGIGPRRERAPGAAYRPGLRLAATSLDDDFARHAHGRVHRVGAAQA